MKDVGMRYDNHPSDMHPCERGEPIVASAIATIRFSKDGRSAIHECNGNITANYRIGTKDQWLKAVDYGSYCQECGLKLPTVEQIAEMYEWWKEEHHDKNA
jgi:hypothetical protein